MGFYDFGVWGAKKTRWVDTNPEFETDWHDCLLDLGISALTSGITNTLTIGSGRGEIFGAWKGLGIPGHSSASDVLLAKHMHV